MLFPRNITVFCFIFKYVTNSKLILGKDENSVSRFIAFHMDVPSFRTIYWKDYPFFSLLSIFIYQNQLTVFLWVYFWALYSVWLTHLSILSAILSYSAHCSFIRRLRVRCFQFSNSALFIVEMAILNLLLLHTNFRWSLSKSIGICEITYCIIVISCYCI